jgi:hypothetical protein
MSKKYKIIKSTCSKLVGTIFEYAIINDGMAPKWFTQWSKQQFEPLAKDVADLKVRVTKIEEFNAVVKDYMKSHP